MVVESPSNKSLRFTAIDAEGHIKVFLVMARSDEITELFRALKERVSRQKEHEEELANTYPKAPVEIRVEEVGDDDDDTGEPVPKKAILEENSSSTSV